MKLIDKINSKFNHKDEKTSNIIKLPVASYVQSDKPQNQTAERQERMHKIIEENKRKFRFLIVQFIFVLIMYITVIGLTVSSTTMKLQTEKEIEELNIYISELSNENAALRKKVEELEKVNESEYVVNKKTSKKAVGTESIYYGKTYKDLRFDYNSDDEAANLLECISFVEYGTAGSSLQMYSAGYNFVLISQMDEEKWSEIPILLASLSPVQLDFLSYRVFDAYHFAIDIINGEDILFDLNSMGINPENYQNCTEIQLIKFLGFMVNLFEKNAVIYEWEDTDVLSLFK